jgi:GntR family transcriptional regulator
MAELARDLQLFDSVILSPADALPLYQQLARHLRQLIARGALPPDQPLPAERELAERLSVSRVTLRKALQELVEDGLIDQRPRAGTYVRRIHVEQALSGLTGFSEDMHSRGLEPASQWLNRSTGPATPEEIAALDLAAGDSVSRLWRIRLVDGSPMALELAAIPCRFLPDPLVVDGSLYDTLRQLGHPPHRALQRLSAIVLNPQQAEMLSAPAGAAALYIERRTYLADGCPLEFVRSQYRGDAYDVVVELSLTAPLSQNPLPPNPLPPNPLPPNPLTERRS